MGAAVDDAFYDLVEDTCLFLTDVRSATDGQKEVQFPIRKQFRLSDEKFLDDLPPRKRPAGGDRRFLEVWRWFNYVVPSYASALDQAMGGKARGSTLANVIAA